MSNVKAVTRYLAAAALELAAELSEYADSLDADAVGNTDSAELIEALNMTLDGLIETAHKYNKRIDGLNKEYLLCF